jgi:cell division protein ZapB
MRALCLIPRARLTARLTRFIVIGMSENSKNPVDAELRRLEKRVDELVSIISRLREENRALRQRQDSLATERAALVQKNEQVRNRVEAMIGRLKTLEHGA